MKKILSLLEIITLIGTSTTSLVACNTPNEYTPEELAKLKEENKINTTNQTIRDNLEWMASQESPFNEDKYYYVIWRGNKNDNWRIVKFKHYNDNGQKVIDNYDIYKLISSNDEKKLFNLFILKEPVSYFWLKKDDGTHFKSVYRWNLDTQEPTLIIDDKGNVKFNGE
ncbi:hypothetical protein [Spiroplasma endosymbiont of Ammophila pubescens]|uniref:hypothetical protein n=1 Tax=Spiroplasma endosymbiont of Ammophila pubescens TaxID=3066315 RepID=UPI0032B2A6FD